VGLCPTLTAGKSPNLEETRALVQQSCTRRLLLHKKSNLDWTSLSLQDRESGPSAQPARSGKCNRTYSRPALRTALPYEDYFSKKSNCNCFSYGKAISSPSQSEGDINEHLFVTGKGAVVRAAPFVGEDTQTFCPSGSTRRDASR
jgi:hypothetical protein